MTSDHQRIVQELLSKCLEFASRSSSGGELADQERESVEVPFAEICADHPGLVQEVKEAFELANRLPSIQVGSPRTAELSGSLIGGRYEVQDFLGRGAMGVVYAATDLELGRTVAIKVLNAGLFEREAALARFEREASALAAVEHPSVVTIYDRGLTETADPFLVMERVNGVVLSDLLELAASRLQRDDDIEWIRAELGIDGIEERSYLRQAARWTAEIASGLEAMHAIGIYHRDVKPSNIMIRQDGRAVLLDFGIVAQLDSAKLTRTDAAIGTPAYMPPEALQGGGTARPTLDVYGLAATLYHLLTLKPPYEGPSSSVLAALATRDPIPAIKLRPGLPRDAQAILDHGLTRSPRKRYASMDRFNSDLNALLTFQPVSVRPTSSVTRAVRRIRRSKVALGIGLTLLVGALLSGVQSALQFKEEQRAAAYDRAYVRVPANLGLLPRPRYRQIDDLGLRQGVAETLEDLQESGYQTVTADLLSGLFLFDHGDLAGALADFRAVASEVDTPYANEWLARFEALDPASEEVVQPDWTVLPAPSSSLDLYIDTVSRIREDVVRDSEFAPAHPGLEDLRHYQEMRARLALDRVIETDRDRDRDDSYVEAEQLIRRVELLERRFGSRSSLSAHIIGTALIIQDRFADGLLVMTDAIELSPAAYHPLNNAANALMNLSRLDEARVLVGRARQVVNDHPRMRGMRVLIEQRSQDFEAARRVLRDSWFPPGKDGELDRLLRISLVGLEESKFYVGGDQAKARGAAEATLASLEDVPVGYSYRDWIAQQAETLLSGETGPIFSYALGQAESDPASLERIEELARLWPTDLSSEHAASLKSWCSKLARELARPGRVETRVD